MTKQAKHPVQTTEKSLQIIEALKQEQGARITELANKLNMGKSVVHNHLSTLEEHGYVINQSNTYKLSLKFLDHGGNIRNEMDMFRVAEPEVNKLAEESGELVNLLVEENGRGVILYRAKGEKAVDLDTYVGKYVDLHTTALGKAILAQLPEGRVDEIINQHGLPEVTKRTISDRSQLFDALDTIEQRGFAIDDEERLEGLRCVAAPIRFSEESVGAISISAPVARMTDNWDENEYVHQVCGAANVIDLNKF